MYAFSLALCSMVYFLFYRKYFISIWDPIFISLVFSTFASATPVFLYLIGEITTYYFLIFLSTQLAFLIGVVSCKPFKFDAKPSVFKLEGENIAFKVFFLLIFFIHFGLQLVSYKLNGIPVLLASKLEADEGTGLPRLINRIVSCLNPF